MFDKIFVIFVALACAVDTIHAILGGSNATPRFNHVVRVETGNGDGTFPGVCSGSFLAATKVLTAGHCCKNGANNCTPFG